MSGPAKVEMVDFGEDAEEFAQRYAEKAMELAQAAAHTAINARFGAMREALGRATPKPRKAPEDVEAPAGKGSKG